MNFLATSSVWEFGNCLWLGWSRSGCPFCQRVGCCMLISLHMQLFCLMACLFPRYLECWMWFCIVLDELMSENLVAKTWSLANWHVRRETKDQKSLKSSSKPGGFKALLSVWNSGLSLLKNLYSSICPGGSASAEFHCAFVSRMYRPHE